MTTIPFLVIALIAGYNFASKCTLSRYSLSRKTGYSLYFTSAIYGLIILFISFHVLAVFDIIGTGNIRLTEYINALYGSFTDDVSLNRRFIDSLTLATLTIAASYVYIPVNLIWKLPFLRKWAFEHAIKNRDFEQLIWRAIKTYSLIQITNSNSKVYVGYVIRTIDPQFERTELRMLPVLSGYRNSEGSIVFKNMYTFVLEKLQENITEGTPDENILNSTGLTDFEIVLPYAEIRHTGLFNFETYADTGNSFKKTRKNVRVKK